MTNMAVTDKQNERKKPAARKLLEWLGFFAVGAIMMFFFSPPSWWQFGVSPTSERKAVADFVLAHFEGGDNWKFADQRGKVLVINYWATWCGPCRFEMPGLVKVASELAPQRVAFVGVSVDEDTAAITPFVDKYQIPYPILLPGDDPNTVGRELALPTTFLYDKNGKLAKKYTGIVLESTLRSDIGKLLAEN